MLRRSHPDKGSRANLVNNHSNNAKIEFVTSVRQVPGQPTRSPWLCFSKFENAQKTQFRFNGLANNWKIGSSSTEGKVHFFKPNQSFNIDKTFKVQIRGAVYSQHITASFGITDLKAWEALAGLVLPNTVMWMSTIINHDSSDRLDMRLRKQNNSEQDQIEVKVEDLIADFGNALRKRIGIPVSASIAAKILSKPLPDEAARRAAKQERLGSVVCLTENPHLLAEGLTCQTLHFY